MLDSRRPAAHVCLRRLGPRAVRPGAAVLPAQERPALARPEQHDVGRRAGERGAAAARRAQGPHGDAIQRQPDARLRRLGVDGGAGGRGGQLVRLHDEAGRRRVAHRPERCRPLHLAPGSHDGRRAGCARGPRRHARRLALRRGARRLRARGRPLRLPRRRARARYARRANGVEQADAHRQRAVGAAQPHCHRARRRDLHVWRRVGRRLPRRPAPDAALGGQHVL
mmetsp:Transcript_59634/g.177183  ORF Transcript_59634/g.177183 Transcript_59634/m.177183 type:complete len:225 (-) Transcript_59634:236-910(-)